VSFPIAVPEKTGSMEERRPLFAGAGPRFYNFDFTASDFSVAPPLPAFPNPYEYFCYPAFERESVEWKRDRKRQLTRVILPVPVSIGVFRPRGAGPTRFVPSRSGGPPPYGPPIHDSVLAKVLSPDASLDFSEVMRTVNRREYLLSEYIFPGERWQAQLVPKEPVPYLYRTYGEYAAALRNWREIGIREATVEHPTLFEKSMDLVKQVRGARAVFPAAAPARAQALAARGALPSSDVLSRLFESTSQPPPAKEHRYPIAMPFVVPFTPQALVDWYMQPQGAPPREVTKGLQMAKVYGVPWFLEQPLRHTSDELPLVVDQSPVTYSARLAKNDGSAVDVWISQFAFLLPQVCHIPDNRFLCRMYLLLNTLVQTETLATIFLCFTDTTTIVNTTKLLTLFTAHPITDFDFFPVEDEAIESLERDLLRWNLAKVLSLLWTSPAAQESLNDILATAITRIDDRLPSVASNFVSFFASSAGDQSACCLIVQLLTNARPSAIFSLFTNHNHLFRWLGELSLTSHNHFGRICCSLALSTDAQLLFLTGFLRAQTGPLTSRGLSTLTHLCGFVSLLMRLIVDSDLAVDPLDLHSCVLKACQMISYNPESVLEMLLAITRFYWRQLCLNAKPYVNAFFQFRLSFLFLFDQKLDGQCLLRSLEAVRFLFGVRTSGRDPTQFAELFLMHLLGFMALQQEVMLAASWSVFRNWVLTEGLPAHLLRGTDYLRAAFSALLASAGTSNAIAVQLLLVGAGCVHNPETGESTACPDERRAVKVRDMIEGVLRQHGIQMAALAERVAADPRYVAEMRIVAARAGRKPVRKIPGRKTK
jgi:hypothetical protein